MLPLQLLLPLQSLLNQPQYLPKLKINQQSRGRHLNALESDLEAVAAAGVAVEEVAEVVEVMEVAEVVDSGMEEALEDLVMAATDS